MLTVSEFGHLVGLSVSLSKWEWLHDGHTIDCLGFDLESRKERQENFLLQGQLSVLTLF